MHLQGSRMSALIPLILVFSGASGQALTGPREVTGTLGGSVSVECRYEAEYRDSGKYWCQGPTRLCDTVVKTSTSEREVRKGRVSIRDSPESGSFTVIMEGLRREDAGSYRCGIDRTALLDHMLPVSVVVLQASRPLPSTTISAKTVSSLPTTTPSISINAPYITSTEFSSTCCVQRTLDPKASKSPHDYQPHPTRPHSLSRSSDWIVLYLLPAGAFLLILLLLAAVFLIRSQRNKKKASMMQSPAYAVVRRPPASASATSSATPDTCYAEIRDLAQETSGSQDVPYAYIQFEESEQQQDVYMNMQVIRKDPSLECEYDTVRV